MRLTEKHLRIEKSGILAPLYWINENDAAVEFHNRQYGGGKAIDKLGHLEDIEDELGVDLITLFKALKNGIWVKYDVDFGITGKPKIVIEKDKCTEICLREKKWWIQENDFLLKDYGKTWALTKEELI